MIRTLIAALVLTLAGCGAREPNSAQQPQEATLAVPLDLSTPDQALKSYWRSIDAIRLKVVTNRQSSAQRQYDAMLKRVTLPGLIEDTPEEGKPETFLRDIENVDIQSDSRAVVIARIRNSTPIPPGAEVTDYDRGAREKGDRYKYVFGKAGEEWRLAELWEWDDISTNDWRKVFPRDGKPSVPTLTYNGR